MTPVVHLDDVSLRDWTHGERYRAQLGRVGAAVGARQLGCQLHIVPPGKAAFPRHAHHANEEMLIILEGVGTYEIGDETHPVRAGHVCAAPAGDGSQAHQLRNTGEMPLKYLCLSTRHDPDVVEYPDSGKFMVASRVPEGGGLRAARIAYVGRAKNTLDYWEGEPE